MTKETTKPFLLWCKKNGVSAITDGIERKFVDSICMYSVTPEHCILMLYGVNELKELTITTEEYSRLYDEWEELLNVYEAAIDDMIDNYCNQEWDDQDPMYV